MFMKDTVLVCVCVCVCMCKCVCVSVKKFGCLYILVLCSVYSVLSSVRRSTVVSTHIMVTLPVVFRDTRAVCPTENTETWENIPPPLPSLPTSNDVTPPYKAAEQLIRHATACLDYLINDSFLAPSQTCRLQSGKTTYVRGSMLLIGPGNKSDR